jgi:hypothetical protein
MPRYSPTRPCFLLPLISMSWASSPCLVIHHQGLALHSHWLACLHHHRLLSLFTPKALFSALIARYCSASWPCLFIRTKALFSTPIARHVFSSSASSPCLVIHPKALLSNPIDWPVFSIIALPLYSPLRPCSPLPLNGMSSASSPCLVIHRKSLLSSLIDWRIFISIALPRYSPQGLALHSHWLACLHHHRHASLFYHHRHASLFTPKVLFFTPMTGMSSSPSSCLVIHLQDLALYSHCLACLRHHLRALACIKKPVLPQLLRNFLQHNFLPSPSTQCFALCAHWLACLEHQSLYLVIHLNALSSTPVTWLVFNVIDVSWYSHQRIVFYISALPRRSHHYHALPSLSCLACLLGSTSTHYFIVHTLILSWASCRPQWWREFPSIPSI